MLTKFEVENYKNFKENFTLDFTAKNYAFNSNLINDDIIRTGIIFGKNASGKSNLTLALMDIVSHLFDKQRIRPKIYKNLERIDDPVTFKYYFDFDGHEVIYKYSKESELELIEEKITVDDKVVIYYNHKNGEFINEIPGTEQLKSNLMDNELPLSYVKYVYHNTIFIKDDYITNSFISLIEYVDKMLMFYSLGESNRYAGFEKGASSISDTIIRLGMLQDFEEFLRSVGIKFSLFEKIIDGNSEIFVDFSNGKRLQSQSANFFTIASTGTSALALYYHWIIKAADASLIIMDEFDAFYHYELADIIIKETLKRTEAQLLFTTHNTTLMSNDSFRPDTLFVLQNRKITCLSDLTEKELRQAHNLQKMYIAGVFNE